MTKRTLLLIIGGLVAVIGGGFMLFASGDNSGQLQQRLSARQDTTLKLIADGQKNISGDDLAKVNSELSIILHGDDTALSAALKTAGLKKVDKAIKAAEADTESFEALTTARLNAQYDITYQNILTQKLESLQALLKELHDKTRSKSLKAAVATEYKHVGIYLAQLEALAKN